MIRRKVESYVALAREDLEAAKRLGPSLARPAAYHIEQAAEKLLKAVLTVEGIGFPTTHHQLGALAQMLPANHVWRPDLMSFDEFSSNATQIRYPTPGGGMPPEPDRADLERALKHVTGLAGEIGDWCAEKLAETGSKKGP